MHLYEIPNLITYSSLVSVLTCFCRFWNQIEKKQEMDSSVHVQRIDICRQHSIFFKTEPAYIALLTALIDSCRQPSVFLKTEPAYTAVLTMLNP